MRIAVLTSSRADYSIYLPLLKVLQNDDSHELSIIAFGTHLSQAHGHTIDKIVSDGFEVAFKLDTMPLSDSPAAISAAMGKTMTEFAAVWNRNRFDLVFALGDRYEMFAACASGLPFNISFAHIHGGEQTLGAIDDAFRHSITHMSCYHFTTTEQYRQRVEELKGSNAGVHNVGALSIDNLKTMQLLSKEEFREQFHIDLSQPTILITFHPETVSYQKNEQYTDELISALEEVKGYQLIITMPNADTMGSMIRSRLNAFIARNEHVTGVESLGTVGYLSCMKHCSMLLGNTSSGFVEAAYFPKYVINLGERQTGRIVTPNIRNTPIQKEHILEAIAAFNPAELPSKIDVYGSGNAAEKILAIINKQ